MRDIADAAWRCADPGVQYDTTINQWHTSPNSGRINASNPCSEYMHVDDSACNLASLNLMKFRKPDGTFDVATFEHAVDIVLLAQEIIVGAVLVPDGGDRRQRPRVPPARPRLREPRRLPDGRRHAVRLGRRPRHRRRDHGADDRPRVPAVGEDRRRRSARTRSTRENREAHNNVMRMHRDASYAIPDSTCADDGPAGRGARGVERGRRARRALRLPQRAGDGARADGDDLVPDGLRHDRRRARLLAGQVQGARRRRQHGHRQPHGAAGAARRSATRRTQIEQIEAHITEHGTIVGAPRPGRRSTCRSSTSRSASARSRTWATSR